MGNFFSKYHPASHSCTPEGHQGGGSQKRSRGAPRLRRAVNFPRVEKACSHEDHVQEATKHHTTKSYPADPSKVSLLDLPGELRNEVYKQLLVVEGYVRITSNGKAWTKVPDLTLIRTCKQVHDEAASFFYGMNSFYCDLKKFLNVPDDIAPSTDAKTLVTPCEQLQSHIKLDAGGVLFPAPRYQRWLTRVTLDIEVHIRNPWLYLTFDYSKPQNWEAELAKSDAARRHMHHALSHLFDNQYQTMKALWAEKNTQCKGRFVALSELNTAGTSQHMYKFTLSFFEGGDEVPETRGILWSCNTELPIGRK